MGEPFGSNQMCKWEQKLHLIGNGDHGGRTGESFGITTGAPRKNPSRSKIREGFVAFKGISAPEEQQQGDSDSAGRDENAGDQQSRADGPGHIGAAFFGGQL